MNFFYNLVVLFSIFQLISCYYILPGPSVRATKGEVWPKPQHQRKSQKFMVLQPENFHFKETIHSCKILQEAFSRYLKIIIKSTNLGRHVQIPKTNISIIDDPNFTAYLTELKVELTEPCHDHDIPTASMHENYTLSINTADSEVRVLKSKSIWGILRGLETFSQLIHLSNDGVTLVINSTKIVDYPRFKHRGLLLDTSRHYMPMFTIFQVLDGMAYNKLNVFHWHITDDQSFPYVSLSFPELSEYGAYHPKLMIYKPENVQKVIKYAAHRGIRVMVEFDTPGHTRSWGEARPELLTECYTPNVDKPKPNGYLGPIDPTKTTTYKFMSQFFKEIVNVFPEKYVHLGGDEVDFDCWQSNPGISEWMKKQNIVGDYVKLEEYYVQKLVNIVRNLNASSVVWEEVYVNGVTLPSDAIIHVWKGDTKVVPDATKDGFRVLWSSCWYLDHLSSGGDWQKYYKCDPHTAFNLTPEQERLVIGGEACMWGEAVDATNVVQRIFPRASAVAEKLWSNRQAHPEHRESSFTVFSNTSRIDEAARRLEEHSCRMNVRGIPAQPPNGPGFCLFASCKLVGPRKLDKLVEQRSNEQGNKDYVRSLQ